jgi:hypothetical protein
MRKKSKEGILLQPESTPTKNQPDPVSPALLSSVGFLRKN